jgi:hypothetical protein
MNIYLLLTMPLTEAQKRAQKKWREANKERYNAYRNEWQKTKEGYREKQQSYNRKYKSKVRDLKIFMAEVERLLAIEFI